ncbi:MAG: RluA family pseudouridine synthase [Polyangiales bacterium]
MSSDPSGRVFVVPDRAAGLRLDHFLVQHVPHMTRALATALSAAGEVRVDGRRARKGDRVVPGAHVELLRLPEPADFAPTPWDGLALDVRHEDEHVVVVEKPRGLPTHPLRREERETLAQALLHRYPEMAGVGYALREPGVLHRLDTDTSGLVVAARTASAFDALRSSQRTGAWTKSYVALCEGVPRTPDRIETTLGPDPTDPRRMRVLADRDETNPQVTELTEARVLGALQTADGARVQVSAVHVRVEKATRHQIRVHLAYYGHPLVGDTLYGGAALAGDESPPAHWLHACAIAFPHPAQTDTLVRVESPTTTEMRDIEARAAAGASSA